MHDDELILHRYEGSGVVTPAKAAYRYFVQNQVGGMLISDVGKSKTSLKGRRICAYYPLAKDNMAEARREPSKGERWQSVTCLITQKPETAIYIEERQSDSGKSGTGQR